MSGDRVIELQHQVRESTFELQNYLQGLSAWEQEMKRKDEEIRKKRLLEEQEIPPIRSAESKAKKNKKCKSKKKEKAEKADSYDRESKDDSSDDVVEFSPPVSEESNLMSTYHKKQMAVKMKDHGNELFKKGNYKSAISWYTNGIDEDAENALLYANRGMAYLKTGELALAEDDCNKCLSLDPTYVKAYLRRGTARLGQKKYETAETDFLKVLELEPDNKQAKSELKKIELEKQNQNSKENKTHKSVKNEVEILSKPEEKTELCNSSCSFLDKNSKDATNKFITEMPNSKTSSDFCIISPVKKTVHERSKKPLVSVKVRDVHLKGDNANEYKDTRTLEKDNFVNNDSPNIVEQKDKSEIKTDISKQLNNVNSLVPSLPPVPLKSYQFLTCWKKLKKFPDLQYAYLEQFPPDQFPILFKESMEADLFCDILKVLNLYFLKNNIDVFPYVKCLCKIGRFETLVRFLLSDEREALNNIFASVESFKLYPTEEMREVKQKYML